MLSFCNARQMTAPEAYIQYSTELFADDGTILNERTEAFLTNFMAEFREHIQRVLTVLPQAVAGRTSGAPAPGERMPRGIRSPSARRRSTPSTHLGAALAAS